MAHLNYDIIKNDNVHLYLLTRKYIYTRLSQKSILKAVYIIFL